MKINKNKRGVSASKDVKASQVLDSLGTLQQPPAVSNLDQAKVSVKCAIDYLGSEIIENSSANVEKISECIANLAVIFADMDNI